jgi:peptidyl-prolyl cis-trans isomerase C
LHRRPRRFPDQNARPLYPNTHSNRRKTRHAQALQTGQRPAARRAHLAPGDGCQKAKPAATGTVATVNGVAIPQSIANAFVAEQKAQGAPDSPELKNAVREELIRRELLVQEAKKLGLDKKPDVAAQADLARQAIFIRAFVQDFVKKHPISDEQLKAAYDRMKTQMGNTEYKVRHILVEKEDDAKTIIANLKKGAKFDDLAKQSKDPGSRTRAATSAGAARRAT